MEELLGRVEGRPTTENWYAKVLLIEDNPGDAVLVSELLSQAKQGRFEVEWVETLSDGLAALDQRSVDVVLLDLTLPECRGIETFLAVQERADLTPIVVLSGLDDEAVAVQAIQAGAQDYLVKGGIDSALLARTLRYALERARTQRGLRFLANASSELARSLDFDETLHKIAQLAIGRLGDCCVIHLVGTGDVLQQPAVSHTDPQKLAVTRELLDRYPIRLNDPKSPLGRLIRSGEPALYPRPLDPLLETLARDDDHLALLRAQGIASGMAVPVRAGGQVIGALTITSCDPTCHYDEFDLAITQELANRAGLAVQNARLYREAQRAIQLRDEFLATAAHDLKTPITAAKGYAQYLRRRVAAGRDRAGWLDEGFDHIEQSMLKLTLLIDDLLDVARLREGRPLELERRPTDLVRLARELVKDHQATTEHHRLRFEVTVPEMVGMWDAMQLERVLSNLLGNALRYSPNGGEITVRVSLADDGCAVLEVSDQGVGIPAADVTRIFEPYRRGSNVEGRIAGLGIGLAAVRRIVEEHHGEIRIDSREGVGTTVTVQLPLVPPPQARAARESATPAAEWRGASDDAQETGTQGRGQDVPNRPKPLGAARKRARVRRARS